MGIGESSSLDSEQIIYTAIGYDDKSRVESMENCISYSYLLGGVTAWDTDSIEYLYYYTDDGRLDGYTVSGDFTVNATLNYDTLDRVSSVVYTNSVDDNSLNISESYLYNDNTTDGASGQVKEYTSTVGTDSESYTYTYDNRGYVTRVRHDSGKSIKYTYNNLGWLIEEDNAITYKIYTYAYDSAGNIIRVTETEKTPNDDLIQMGVVGDGTASTFALLPLLPDLPPIITHTYGYTDSEWGDLLTKYNGVDITYDEIGNPLSYYNGSSYTFTWNGRRLATAVKGADTMSFAYDSDGLRISKTVNGVTTYYVYDGELLVAEYTDTTAIVYIYDANDSPIGFKCRENTYTEDVWDVYWYGKNLQGDIAAIYNSAGTKLVSYTYTAWGVTTKAYHNDGADTTAVHNNLTYRGYYYDSDLGMYYLQTRYYDAEICRFINADAFGYLGANNDITGYNLYTYCGNNPVMYIDCSGKAYMPFKDLTWPGEIHREVQEYLKSKGYEIEHRIVGIGRIDLVKNKEAYEIKPFTYNSKLGRKLATNQLLWYTNNSTYTVGTDNPDLHGSFVSSNGKYNITFHYGGDGLIFYSFSKNGATSKSHSYSAAPVKSKENQNVSGFATAVFAACVCIAFSGSPGNISLKNKFF